MDNYSAHVGYLEQILGPSGVLSGTMAKGYEVGARYGGGSAAFVLRPRSTSEVSAAVAYCVANGIPIIPQSGNTGLVGGSTPDQGGRQAVLSLDRYKDPLQIDAGNRSVRAGAGVRLSRPERGALGPRACSIRSISGRTRWSGGMVSTNTGGSRFIRYGDVRRSVLGLRWCSPTTRVPSSTCSHLCERTMSALDLKQLFIGSGGSFGVVTQAVLDVARLPLQSAAALLIPASDAAVPALLSEIERRVGDYISSFEGMSAQAMSCAIQHVPSVVNPFANRAMPPYAILLELSCTWSASENAVRLDDVLQNALGEIGELDRPLLDDALLGRDRELWTLRHSLSEGLHRAGPVIAMDVSVRRDQVMSFRARATALVAARFPTLRVCDFGHLGDGGVHFNMVAPRAAASELGALDVEVRSLILSVVMEEFGGSFSAEHGIGRANEVYRNLYVPEVVRGLTRRISGALGTGEIGFRAAVICRG